MNDILSVDTQHDFSQFYSIFLIDGILPKGPYLVCPFSRAWLLVIRRSLYDLARSWTRAICAGDLHLYPMFCRLVRPTWDTVWQGENLIRTTMAPDFSSYMFHELRVSLSNKVSKGIRRLPCASIVGKNPNQDLDPFKKRKNAAIKWTCLLPRTTVNLSLEWKICPWT